MTVSVCSNCGAPLSGGWVCRYCRAETDPKQAGVASLAELAQTLGSGVDALESSLPRLVAALQAALPGEVMVEHESGLLRRQPRLRSVTARVGDHRFRLAREGGRFVAAVDHEVRGVVLKHDQVPLGDWLLLLGQRLRDLAAEARAIQPALARLLGESQP